MVVSYRDFMPLNIDCDRYNTRVNQGLLCHRWMIFISNAFPMLLCQHDRISQVSRKPRTGTELQYMCSMKCLSRSYKASAKSSGPGLIHLPVGCSWWFTVEERPTLHRTREFPWWRISTKVRSTISHILQDVGMCLCLCLYIYVHIMYIPYGVPIHVHVHEQYMRQRGSCDNHAMIDAYCSWMNQGDG